MASRRRRRAALLSTALAAAVGASLLAAVPAAAGTPPEPSALQAKAEVKVERQLATQDKATFWVQLDSEGDTAKAKKAKSKADKGRAVIAAKKEHAERTQAGIKRLLKDAPYDSYWISNTLRVTVDKALAEKIAARDEVTALQADTPVALPEPQPGPDENFAESVDSVGWNIDRINAPKVWDELGKRGEDVVVAGIDSGVDVNHPALRKNYRGTKSDGTYDHAYNWFDPTGRCGATTPCDNRGHGTHTMGTMVGDDGADNAIGVAPGARWIAAKGCEASTCTRDSLLASGQWMLAPTDLTGANARPDLAPDVINNSWGITTLDIWYKATVQAWRDAGIFASFSNGNSGPGCNTAGSPGGYDNAYSSGAFDIDGNIADFSSRGAGEGSGIKPNIAAPGVGIRSAEPGGGYQSMNGTSMAAPHTAGTVALMWSAAPEIRGNVEETEKLLDASAVDTFDPSCGGTAADNNVFGEGKLDAYAAVLATPRGPLGALTGSVTSAGQALADATISLEGPMRASVRTGADGTYALTKAMAGQYTVSVSKYGYVTDRTTVTVLENHTVTRDADLTKAVTGTVTGTVRVKGSPEAGAALEVSGAPVTTTTGDDGTYRLELPVGDYQLSVAPAGRCSAPAIAAIQAGENGIVKDIDLPTRTDGFGTTCRPVDVAYPTGDTRLTLAGSSSAVPVQLPFPVALYGRTYSTATVTSEGYVTFGANSTTAFNEVLPYIGAPNGVLYPFWDNLLMDNSSGVYTAFRGTAPHRELVVEWRDMILSDNKPQRLSFAAAISEDGGYTFHYKDIGDGAAERGSSATIGAENHDGTEAFQYSANEAVLRDGSALEFRTDKSASVAGVVTDGNDGKAVQGATVAVTRGGEEVATGTTRPDGAYLVQVPAAADPAAYEIKVTAAHYESISRTATLARHGISRADSVLRTARVTASPGDALTVVVPAGETRKRTVTLANSGIPTGYTVKEKAGADWLTAGPATGSLGTGAAEDVELTFDTAGAEPGSVLRGTVQVASDSGRDPVIEIPVTMSVPAYRTAVDAGSGTPATDRLGEKWGGDRAYTEGSYGYLGKARTLRTNKTVAGTEEQALYSTATEGAYEYRFDGLPDGVYEVELGFAEIGNARPGDRLFDVLAEGTEKLGNVDVAAEANGGLRALDKRFTAIVTDGQLNLRFASPSDEPLVSTLRVTHRPDLAG